MFSLQYPGKQHVIQKLEQTNKPTNQQTNKIQCTSGSVYFTSCRMKILMEFKPNYYILLITRTSACSCSTCASKSTFLCFSSSTSFFSDSTSMFSGIPACRCSFRNLSRRRKIHSTFSYVLQPNTKNAHSLKRIPRLVGFFIETY